MCIQRDPHNWSADMYDRYRKALQEYLTTYVAPNLCKAKVCFETDFLKEWVKRWHNHKLVVRGLSKLFMYLVRTSSTIPLHLLWFVTAPFFMRAPILSSDVGPILHPEHRRCIVTQPEGLRAVQRTNLRYLCLDRHQLRVKRNSARAGW